MQNKLCFKYTCIRGDHNFLLCSISFCTNQRRREICIELTFQNEEQLNREHLKCFEIHNAALKFSNILTSST